MSSSVTMAVPAVHHFARLGGACHHGPVEGRGDNEILPIVLRLRKLEPGLLSGCDGGGNLPLLLVDLFAHGLGLEGANAWIGEIRLGRCQRAARGFQTAAGGGHGRALLIGCRGRLLALAFGDRAGFHQLLISVVIELRQTQRRFLLGEIGFGGRQVGFRLPHAACRIHFGLFGEQLVLQQLLLVNRNLVVGRFRSCLGAGEGGAGLVFTRPHLCVVQRGNRVAGLDGVAFTYTDFDNAPGGLWRDGRIVAFDTAADSDNAVRNPGVREITSPDEESGYTQHDHYQGKNLPARTRR